MYDPDAERLSQRSDFREFIANFEGVFAWTGNENGFDYVSSGYEDIFGRPPEHLSDGGFDALIESIHPDDVDRIRDVIESEHEGLTSGQSATFEHRVVRPDGSVRWVEVRVVPVHDDEGNVTEVVGVTIDITDRKRAELDLRRQNDRLEQFANMVSHDLRNPLNVASGHLDLLRTQHDLDDDIDSALTTVEQAHNRMERIVEDLLWLAQEGRDIGSQSAVTLERLVRDAWNHVDTGEAELVVDCDVRVSADDDRLQQLLENLMRNSVEHGSTDNRAEPGDGVEHSSTGNRRAPRADDSVEYGSTDSRTQSGDSVEHGSANDASPTIRVGLLDDRNGFYFEDDGSGIPADERQMVLEAGYSTTDDGTGFGLSIVETIARGHGWSLDITDSAEGGARFEFGGVEFE